ncbi:MAG: PulJ/GspJ family protein [Rubrobacteraceae bacterium]
MKASGRRSWSDESGFTLTEVLVTIMIMIIVLFALYSIFDMGLRIFAFGNDKLEAIENARLGLERMEREIRAAHPYDKTAGNDDRFASYDTNSISFYNNLDDDRVITSATEQISYALRTSDDLSVACPTTDNGEVCTLVRAVGAGAWQPVIEYVEPGGLTFEYREDGGGSASTQSEIDVVRMTLNVQVDEGSQTLTTDIVLRNRSGGS